ncbi:PQ-loop repeat family protein/transmembrane family protein [Abeliophyllum distichum]|uniref:PQ-loop repeat family protein/transmembrane family protein n=1 Tax=Abeliophyllum distichum TaxID=126358 RepID=A0ABD1SWL2_9LAMI
MTHVNIRLSKAVSILNFEAKTQRDSVRDEGFGVILREAAAAMHWLGGQKSHKSSLTSAPSPAMEFLFSFFSPGLLVTYSIWWVAFLNLQRCQPNSTQAVLYTTNTVILVLQSLYYDHFYRCWKGRQNESFQEVEEVKKPLKSPKPDDSAIPIPKRTSTATARRGVYYYTSARSLAGSTTPPIRSYLWPVRSGPSTMGLDNDSSSDDETTSEILKKHVSQPKPIARSAAYGAFLATSISMPQQTKALMQVYSSLTARKLLQEQGTENVYGQWLGWLMTATYMGGRLPQIWLNIKRGSAEGLNPLMFIFALLANATYVASILVRSTAWSKIKANMPWLLDAAGCVGLDLFIILQYIYYKNFCGKTPRVGEGYEDYIEANNED